MPVELEHAIAWRGWRFDPNHGIGFGSFITTRPDLRDDVYAALWATGEVEATCTLLHAVGTVRLARNRGVRLLLEPLRAKAALLAQTHRPGLPGKGERMRTFVYSVLAFGLIAAAIAASPTLADSGNAALVVRSDGCTQFDGNGVLQPVPYHEILNNNTNVVVCGGKVPNDTGKIVHYDQDNSPFGPVQYICALSGNLSTSWHATVTPSGQATTVIVCPSNR